MSDEMKEERLAARVAAAYRRAAPLDPGARRRLDSELNRMPRPRRRRRAFRWFGDPWSLSPAIGLAGLAALLLLGVAIGRLVPGSHEPARLAPPLVEEATHPVEFVLVAPRASHVALVGDFNGWDPRATPMARRGGGGTWTARVTLPPGRHVYSYIVDGAEWVSDPLVPLAPANEFGVRNSVVLVAEARSS